MMLFAPVSCTKHKVHERNLTMMYNMTYSVLVLLLVGKPKRLKHVELRHISTYAFCCVLPRGIFNPLNAELNPFYHFLALLEAHRIIHVSR
jgi:hypothetical protein